MLCIWTRASILNYHNENALSCVISLAYYSARDAYRLIRELPTGKGFAVSYLYHINIQADQL